MKATIGVYAGTTTAIAIYADGLLRDLYMIPCNGFGGHPSSGRNLIMSADSVLVVVQDYKAMPRDGVVDWLIRESSRVIGGIEHMRCGGCVKTYETHPLAKHERLKAEPFREKTGWKARSNQNQRNAAMLAWRFRGVR